MLVISKVIFANSVDPDQTAPLGAAWSNPHCLPVCKNRFEKLARIFSRRHKRTTFSYAGFLGILRVKQPAITLFILRFQDKPTWANQEPRTDSTKRHICSGRLLFAVFQLIFKTQQKVVKCSRSKFRISMVSSKDLRSRGKFGNTCFFILL